MRETVQVRLQPPESSRGISPGSHVLFTGHFHKKPFMPCRSTQLLVSPRFTLSFLGLGNPEREIFCPHHAICDDVYNLGHIGMCALQEPADTPANDRRFIHGHDDQYPMACARKCALYILRPMGLSRKPAIPSLFQTHPYILSTLDL